MLEGGIFGKGERNTKGSWHHPGERRSVTPGHAKKAPTLLLDSTPPRSPTFKVDKSEWSFTTAPLTHKGKKKVFSNTESSS